MPSSSKHVSVNDIHVPKPVMNRNVAPFLNKLYNIVNDPRTNDLIQWSEHGDSFVVMRKQDLEKTVLPQFFRHDRFATFVRQLNMYGFHKVPQVQDGALRMVQGDEGGMDLLEYRNPYFCRDRPDLLIHVTRKKGGKGEGLENVASSEDCNGLSFNKNNVRLKQIVDEMTAIKNHQSAISRDLQLIQKDNQDLWRHMMVSRERDKHQKETVDKILRFLASVFSAPVSVAAKRPGDNRSSNSTTTTNSSNSSSNSDNSSNRGCKKRPLLIENYPAAYDEERQKPASKIARIATSTSPHDIHSIPTSAFPTTESLDPTQMVMKPSNPVDIHSFGTSLPDPAPDSRDIGFPNSVFPANFISFNDQDATSKAPADIPLVDPSFPETDLKENEPVQWDESVDLLNPLDFGTTTLWNF